MSEAGKIVFAGSHGGDSYPCGIAVTPDGTTAYVCLSRANEVAKVDLETLKLIESVPVPPAPYDVAISGNTAIVTTWGRTPAPGGMSAPSSGTEVAIDAHGIAAGGTVNFIDLTTHAVQTRDTDGQPSQIVVSSDGKAFIPCANGDHLTQWDIASYRQDWNQLLTADKLTAPGLAPDAAALSADEKLLYVACGGINAIAVLDRTGKQAVTRGWIPTDWYPIGVVAGPSVLYVVNAKGIGSLGQAKGATKKSVSDFTGTLNHIPLPIQHLGALSKQALAQAVALADTAPVPARSPLFNSPSHPSPIKHVFYVIRENRTYDQVLGDLTQGDGDPKLCVFGRAITPNAHALAEQFVLLDNFYCNGVISADGHAWAVEGNATSYFERAFGGWTRSYPFGDDPISPNESGFIWNDAIGHGVSFRNYGEFDYAGSKQSFVQSLRDLKAGTKTAFTQNIGVVSMHPYSQPDFPGWNMEIPDQVRATRFAADLKARIADGTMATFNIVYLPEDHTGASVSAPTCVADNDQGLGMVVDAISHSSIWNDSAIFVVEDDPQAGYDHVDGHRSPCLVISPYTKRKTVIKDFYNQTSVLHTMEQILGLPPMTRMDAISPVMTTCFQSKPDLTPFTCLPLTTTIKIASRLEREAHWDVSKPDLIDEDKANRLTWKVMRPSEPYPAKFAGAHGLGLAARGLRLAQGNRVAGARVDRDDD